ELAKAELARAELPRNESAHPTPKAATKAVSKAGKPAPKAEAPAKPAQKVEAPANEAEPKKTSKTADAPKVAKGKGGRKSLKELGCKVPDCEDPHRSKGFCSRHYQGWRRGRLEGFVGPEGYVQVGERSFRVAPQLQGEAVSVSGAAKRTGLKVDGKKIEFTEVD
ncbi:MAG: hypothetical protein ACI9VR_004470, partial [Cognaticolwellia sp.]